MSCISVLTFEAMSLTLLILLVTVAVSMIAFGNPGLQDKLMFKPYRIDGNREWYRFVSSGLIHADWMHLLVNMFVLFSFGEMVEFYYEQTFPEKGPVLYFLLYFGGMMTAVLPTYRKHRNNPGYNGLGASGAVSAVVFAFILFNPLERLCLYGVLCLPGVIFGVAYLVFSYYMDKRGGDRVNHDAHLWGAIYGLVFTVLLKPSLLIHFFEQLVYFRNAI